ncbi:MAG TPA: hypothetical protein VK034_13480 [Enhygromyxa sp.]|nr:hypothetical protein [Enhygromyxa sp.]
MATDEQPPTSERETNHAVAWLGKRAGLIILVVLAAIVGLRLMSSWIKWMLIAMVVAAVIYLVKGALRRDG